MTIESGTTGKGRPVIAGILSGLAFFIVSFLAFGALASLLLLAALGGMGESAVSIMILAAPVCGIIPALIGLGVGGWAVSKGGRTKNIAVAILLGLTSFACLSIAGTMIYSSATDMMMNNMENFDYDLERSLTPIVLLLTCIASALVAGGVGWFAYRRANRTPANQIVEGQQS